MRILIFLITLLFAQTSFAQTAIEKGQPAPETGVFLTKEQAAKILADRETAEKICKINQDAAVAVEKNKCEYDKSLLKNELNYEKTKYEQISKLRDVQEERLYDSIADSADNLYWFVGGITIGATAAAATAVGIVIIINQVNP